MPKQSLKRDLLLRNFTLLVGYTGLLIFCFYLAYEIRNDFQVAENEKLHLARRGQVMWVVPLELVILYLFGQFRGFLSYFRVPDLFRLMTAFATVAGFEMVLWIIYNRVKMADSPYPPSRSVIAINFLLCTFFFSGVRMGLRVYRESHPGGSGASSRLNLKRVAIVGAGEVGSTVAADFLARRGLGLKPVVFLDDNEQKHGHEIHGVPVVGAPDRLSIVREAYDIQQIVIALPATASRRVREVVDIAKKLGIETEIVPSMWELASGRVQSSQIRPVELQDLLGREPVSLDSEHIRGMLQDRVIVVTGAGGSIGAELCRQVANRFPKRLILVDQSEVQLFQIEQEMISLGHSQIILPVVASVLDEARMEWIMQTLRPSIVFHAAAHKHVPMMEHQPVEALKNNTLGTHLLAALAAKHGVEKFVLISTDKAINPTSVMGCSKRIAEICVQAIQQAPGNKTCFCAVRFGNVLGSSGSVIPTFKRQIADGGPVTVTHPEVTRYFMTIPESVGLVLQAATQATGGEIFVLDMGQPIKIVDVARQLIELSGFRPEVDIEIKFVGLRPGEKLFEEIQHTGEQFAPTAHDRIMRFIATPASPAQVEAWLASLSPRLIPGDRNAMKQFLTSIVPEYTPFLD